jgi:hypothetical protein
MPLAMHTAKKDTVSVSGKAWKKRVLVAVVVVVAVLDPGRRRYGDSRKRGRIRDSRLTGSASWRALTYL